ncbi:hypothetical protein NQ312_24980, partial [Escherichia coli]|nr:hypothetical protein [Escherichia coli]
VTTKRIGKSILEKTLTRWPVFVDHFKEIKGADTFIFGHTPAVKPLKFANQMYIDTGAVFCGNLTLIQVQGEGAWA